MRRPSDDLGSIQNDGFLPEWGMNAGKAGGRPSERRAEDIGLISSAEDD